MRMAVALEPIRRGMVRRHRNSPVSVRNMALIVQDHGTRAVQIVPACTGKTVTEVDVFQVHEVALVEPADLVKRIPPHKEAPVSYTHLTLPTTPYV